jgi:hypothetical protein
MESDDTGCRDLFNCTLCGDCCKGYGGTYLTAADIDAIAAFVGISTTAFIAGYTRLSGKRRVIAQGENGYCIFWDTLCRIHPVKPRMCRRWPYIPGVLADVANWRSMAASCPGMKADAPADQILDCVARKLASEL